MGDVLDDEMHSAEVLKKEESKGVRCWRSYWLITVYASGTALRRYARSVYTSSQREWRQGRTQGGKKASSGEILHRLNLSQSDEAEREKNEVHTIANMCLRWERGTKNDTKTMAPKTGAATDRHPLGVGHLPLRQSRHQRLRGPVVDNLVDLTTRQVRLGQVLPTNRKTGRLQISQSATGQACSSGYSRKR